MSTLIDDLLIQSSINNKIDQNWYIAKPYEMSGLKVIIKRFKDAWRVLEGKSRAYHYKEDEIG